MALHSTDRECSFRRNLQLLTIQKIFEFLRKYQFMQLRSFLRAQKNSHFLHQVPGGTSLPPDKETFFTTTKESVLLLREISNFDRKLISTKFSSKHLTSPVKQFQQLPRPPRACCKIENEGLKFPPQVSIFRYVCTKNRSQGSILRSRATTPRVA
jgi:hypothetical protein